MIIDKEDIYFAAAFATAVALEDREAAEREIHAEVARPNNELARAKSDEAYWNEFGAPFGWTVRVWTYRHSATFADEVGDWFQINGPVLRALKRVRASLTQTEPSDDRA